MNKGCGKWCCGPEMGVPKVNRVDIGSVAGLGIYLVREALSKRCLPSNAFSY